jgi:hypothetical protein
VLSGSVALLADLVHNAGDAATAIPLGIAFLLRSDRAERYAGLAVVLAIFVSACVAGYESVLRLIEPQAPGQLWVLAVAGAAGFAGNWLAALVRTRADGAWTAPPSSPTGIMRGPTRTSRSGWSQVPRWSRSGSRSRTRSSASPSAGDPPHHVALVAHGPRPRARALSPGGSPYRLPLANELAAGATARSWFASASD